MLRAAAVVVVPGTSALGGTPPWLPFAAAATYGLLKVVPLAGFPASIPRLVAAGDLDAANALESMGFSLAFVVGPAAAGGLVGVAGPSAVLVVDAVSFLLFALAAASVRVPLSPAPRAPGPRPSLAGRGGTGSSSPRPSRSWRSTSPVAGLPAVLVYSNAETSGRRERSQMHQTA